MGARDIIIAAMAIAYDLLLETGDAHFNRFKNISSSWYSKDDGDPEVGGR